MEDNNTLIKILKYYPYAIALYAVILFAIMQFVFLWGDYIGEATFLLMFIIVPLFCVVVLIVTIVFARKWLKNSYSLKCFIELGLSIKRKHKAIFILFVCIGIIGVLTVFLLPATFLVCIFGWFMVVQTGIISSVGIVKAYKNNCLSKNYAKIYIITQFIPFADIIFSGKLLEKLQ